MGPASVNLHTSGIEVDLAVEKGEVEGEAGKDWTTLTSTRPQWIKDRKINILVQMGMKPHPDLKGVPMAIDLAKSPQDRQVMVSDVNTDDSSTSSLFLAGKGDISRDFTAAYIDSPVKGTLALKLTPRRRQPDYEYLVVAIDPVSLQIRGLVTRDTQGGDSTLVFTNLKENQRISDKVFDFRIPRGVDVVNNAARN